MGIARTKYVNLGIKAKEGSFDFDYFLNAINSQMDETIQAISNAKYFKNFAIKDGVLSAGLGTNTLKFYADALGEETSYNKTYEGEALALYCFPYYDTVSQGHKDCLVIYSSDNSIYYMRYYSNFRNFFKYEDVSFSTKPDYLYYIMPDESEAMIFSSANEPLTLITFYSDFKLIENAPKIKNLCVHFDRLFGVTVDGRSKVWFSDELDPTNWNVSSTEGGHISMNDMLGHCEKVISFKNYVFVFREYGITRITAYASQESFSMQNVYISSNYIYSNTACVCGDLIYFLATDGLYSFDGVNVSKVNVGFEKIINGVSHEKAKGVYFKNSYYLMLNTSLSPISEIPNALNSIIRFDCLDGMYDILTDIQVLDIEKMNSSGIEKLVAIELDQVNSSTEFTTKLSQIDYYGALYDEPTFKEWLSPKVDLGVPNYSKNIYAVALQTEEDCYIELITEKMSQTVHFKGSPISQKKSVFVSGVMLEIKIYTNSPNPKISHPIVYFKLGRENINC